MVVYDESEGEHVQNKQGTKYQALRDSVGDKNDVGFTVVYGDVLEFIAEVGGEPGK